VGGPHGITVDAFCGNVIAASPLNGIIKANAYHT
jgi:hypothetical protein